MIHLTLPYPPSVNNYWRRTKDGFYVSKKGVDFRNSVYLTALKNKATKNLSGSLKVEIFVTVPDRRARDLDNLGKAVCDSLKYSKVIEDDKYIDDIRIVRDGYEKKKGKIEVYIREIGGENA